MKVNKIPNSKIMYPKNNISGKGFNIIQNLPDTVNISKESVNSIYFKGMLKKPFNETDMVDLLEQTGYAKNSETYSKKLTEEEKDNLIFAIYPEIKQIMDSRPSGREEFKMFKSKGKDHFFPLSTTVEQVLEEDLTKSDINDLTEFANLADGKIGNYLRKDPDFGIFIFKLMKYNHIYDDFIKQSKKQTAVLDTILKLFRNKPDLATIKALNNYKSLSAFAVNEYLRKLYSGKISEIPQKEQQIIDIIDEYMDKNEIDKPITVIRGEHSSVFNALNTQKGKELIEKLYSAKAVHNEEEVNRICDEISKSDLKIEYPGYLSTSLDKEFDRDIEWEITTTKGIKGVNIDLVNLLSKDTADEKEILFQRNTKLKITDFKYDKEKDQWKIKADLYPN